MSESEHGGEAESGGLDFIRRIVADDLASGRHDRVVTRFPPEPNGYLHLGHAMALNLDFSLAGEHPNSRCHLRFDDTNPRAEDERYVVAQQEDIRWLGFDWGEHLYFASDYFEKLYGYALQLIEKGLAFVDDRSPDEIRATQGTLTEPGVESPFRERSAEENRDLFTRMRAGEFPEGSRVLRAKIDMASPVVAMRDPMLYRIQDSEHQRVGRWNIYPLYDFAHSLSDAIEGITHSLCSIEFVDHRPLYDWFVEHVDVPSRPRQYEFARFNVTHTLTSKRKLRQVIESGVVEGWDDPRMPTLRAMRRRGYPPEAIRNFVQAIGVTKRPKIVEYANLESHVRSVLDRETHRAFGVLRPLKVVIENYPEDREEEFDASNHPQDPSTGTRKIPFCREIYIERDDFMEEPPKKFFRMAPGREVRLRYAYLVTCREAIKDAAGNVVELRCTYDPETRGGDAPDGRKVKGTIHWVSARHAVPAELRLYDRLFAAEDPEAHDEGGSFLDNLNDSSLERLVDARIEPSLATAEPGATFQFERQGYFCVDRDSKPGALVWNRTVGLRDSWAKAAKRGGGR